MMIVGTLLSFLDFGGMGRIGALGESSREEATEAESSPMRGRLSPGEEAEGRLEEWKSRERETFLDDDADGILGAVVDEDGIEVRARVTATAALVSSCGGQTIQGRAGGALQCLYINKYTCSRLPTCAHRRRRACRPVRLALDGAAVARGPETNLSLPRTNKGLQVPLRAAM